MEKGEKEPRTLKVKRMFEPDRIAAINLQIAYEQVMPTKQYRLVLPESPDESLEIMQEKKERSAE
jgi:hypothetical protein